VFQDITIEQLLTRRTSGELTLIDVRSPSEYQENTIPGSLNIPIFDDAERAEIGTIYKQVSVEAAKDRGLEIVSAKLPTFIKTFAQIQGPKAVFCWRGGMRSKTTATVLDLMGIKASRLMGGVRAYRQWVVATLDGLELPPAGYVINGNTGTGKTLILRRLQAEGYPVLDLEAMAGHRGSIFGHIGLHANNQKSFEALLVEQALMLQGSPYVLMEGESKRVGKAVLPDCVVRSKESGTQIFIELPLEERVRHILEDYQPMQHKDELVQAFKHIKNRIHTPIAKEIEANLLIGQFERAVKLLLEHYYDPRYAHAMSQYEGEQIVIHANTIEEAIEAVRAQLPKKNQR